MRFSSMVALSMLLFKVAGSSFGLQKHSLNITEQFAKDCRFVSSESCQEIISTQQQERNLQIIPNPNLGKIHVLVLLIQFQDHQGRNLIDKSVIQDLWDGPINDWFRVNAQNKYEIVNTHVEDWFVTDNTEAHYAEGISGFTPDLKKAMYPALDKLDAEGFDWGPYDSDKNGRLDSVVLFHSGISAVAGETDCHGTARSDRIWPHAFSASLSYDTWTSQDGSVFLSGYTVNSVFDSTCDNVNEPLTPGLTVHEYMHTMDLIDL